jgi:hypothetical protein
MPYSYDRTAASGEENLRDFFENISFKAYRTIRELDETFVGTPDYMGIAYFWNYEYRHSLRDAPAKKRRAVHEAFLKAHLAPADESPQHEAIVKKLVGL